jgi:hypothetical protein
MDDESKSREQLLREVIDLRRRVETCNLEVQVQKIYFENMV